VPWRPVSASEIHGTELSQGVSKASTARLLWPMDQPSLSNDSGSAIRLAASWAETLAPVPKHYTTEAPNQLACAGLELVTPFSWSRPLATNLVRTSPPAGARFLVWMAQTL